MRSWPPPDEDFTKLAERLNLQAGSGAVDRRLPQPEGPGMVDGLVETLKELQPGRRRPEPDREGPSVLRLLSRTPPTRRSSARSGSGSCPI